MYSESCSQSLVINFYGTLEAAVTQLGKDGQDLRKVLLRWSSNFVRMYCLQYTDDNKLFNPVLISRMSQDVREGILEKHR